MFSETLQQIIIRGRKRKVKIKEVFVIFKTHLDIGYTDYAKNVVSNYMNSFIPNAIKVGYELKGSKTPFVWTVGSWMIDRALKNDADKSVERAVEDGILNWHALPFTTHTELMNPTMFKYGLEISENLCRRFGKKTIAAKMTDVPGHTIGMIPYLCRAGVKFLHIGTNPASPVPPVERLFKWKCEDDSIIVMYDDCYGAATEIEDFAICFAHTSDNFGPQSPDEIIAVYDRISKQYPDAYVHAATLDDIAERICRIENLPVVEKEIGDTWIHGAATDPEKLSRYRKILRYLEKNGRGECDLTDNAMLVAEHTWGMDFKKYFHDTKHFTPSELEEVISERKTVEKSWDEQRDYVRKAEKLLSIVPDYPVKKPQLDLYTPCSDPAQINFEISWELFDNSDYDRYKKDYLRITEENICWVKWDYGKEGLADYKGGIFTAHVTESYIRGDERLFKLEFEKEAAREYGLPYFYAKVLKNRIEIDWFDKAASRLPQAFWLKFKGFEENWELNKMGKWIKPADILGSPLISAVYEGIRNPDFEIITEDAALVAPFGRKLLRYNEKNLTQDLYFNLYNNIWGTNFPMWYSDDAKFVFEINPLK